VSNLNNQRFALHTMLLHCTQCCWLNMLHGLFLRATVITQTIVVSCSLHTTVLKIY